MSDVEKGAKMIADGIVMVLRGLNGGVAMTSGTSAPVSGPVGTPTPVATVEPDPVPETSTSTPKAPPKAKIITKAELGTNAAKLHKQDIAKLKEILKGLGYARIPEVPEEKWSELNELIVASLV